MAKTIEEINEKIKEGKAVVATAEEIIGLVKEKGISKAAREVDVVTTGTFGTMCSSGAYFNIGHAKPRIKLGGGRTYLNDVLAYGLNAGIGISDNRGNSVKKKCDQGRDSTDPGKTEKRQNTIGQGNNAKRRNTLPDIHERHNRRSKVFKSFSGHYGSEAHPYGCRCC